MKPNLNSNNYYEILGVEQTCSLKEIKHSYRDLAKQYHPDRNKDKDTHQTFVSISEAYEVLSSEVSRKDYDNSLKDNSSFSFNFSNYDMSVDLDHWANIFDSAFKNIRGEDVNVYCRLTLEELKLGCKKTITLASGKISISIKQESTPNSLLKVFGKGNATVECSTPGDLYIKLIPKPHKDYKLLENGDIQFLQPLYYQDLLLGKSVVIPTLNSKVKIAIPAHTTLHQEFRLKGLGLNKKDLLIKLDLVIPKSLTPKEIEAVKKLNSYSNLKTT
jgi:DnaJ-class molecular chaperone